MKWSLSKTAAVLAVAMTFAPVVAQSQRKGIQIRGRQTGTLSQRLLRADAPQASTAPVPAYDPFDPSLALAFNSTIGGVNLNGVGQHWTPIANDPDGFFAVCTTQRIGARTIIAAAHCATDENSGSLFGTSDAFARFLGPGSTTSARTWYDYGIADFHVQSDWFGFNNANTNILHDVLVINMVDVLPSWMTTYSLFSGDPWFAQSLHVGYGTYGTGVGNTNFDSRRRWGTNEVDLADDELYTDFDNGTPQWDVFCLAYGICDQGLTTEAGVAAGDSGGPLFIDGKLAGVTSFGTYFCANAQCDPYSADPDRPFDAFGAINGFAPLSENAEFIATTAAPEPATVTLMASGLFIIGCAVRRRRRR